jgi:hypothetical protein
MNQLADSRKKYLRLNVGSPMFYLRSWLLSHTVRRSRAEIAKIESRNAFRRVTKPFEVRHFARAGAIRPHSTYPGIRFGGLFFAKNGEQKETTPRQDAAFEAG